VVLKNNRIINSGTQQFRLFDADRPDLGTVTDAGGNTVVDGRGSIGAYPTLPAPPKG